MNSPLPDKRILVTRADEKSSFFSEALIARGAKPIEIPVISFQLTNDIGALKETLAQLDVFEWIVFTSGNGVRFFFDALNKQNIDFPKNVRTAVVGNKTLALLEQYGVTADVVPETFTAEALADKLKTEIYPGDRVLMARGNLARKDIVHSLQTLKASVSDVIVYETMLNEAYKETLRALVVGQKLDLVTFTSSSTVNNFFVLLDGINWRKALAYVHFACIGPVTAKTLSAHQIQPEIIAEEYSIPGLVEAIETFYKK